MPEGSDIPVAANPGGDGQAVTVPGPSRPSAEDREAGFIVLHRRLESWPLYRSLRAEHRHVITTLLFAANWKPGAFWYGSGEVQVGRGEFAHSLESIAERAGTSIKVVRTTIEKLLTAGFLSDATGTRTGRQPRVLRIEKYDDYQSPGHARGTQSGTQGARKGHKAGTQGALIEPEQPEQPGEPEKTAAKAADPRHAPLVAKLVEVFTELRSGRYPFGPRDARHVTELLALGDPAAVERAWRAALASDAYPRVRTLAELARHWTHFLGTGPPSTAQPQRSGQLKPSTEYKNRGVHVRQFSLPAK